MTLNEYQTFARSTAIYPDEASIVYPALKLAGEAGEVAEKVGKCIRDNEGDFDALVCGAIIKECGDVLWYLASMAHDCGYTLEEVARMNLEKLQSRQERGTLQGSGDDR